jgi:hypothetical protein
MSFVNWVFDNLSSEDVIDLYFVLSDLVEVNLTEAELCESAYYDSMANHTANNHKGKGNVPIGKVVI